MFYFALISALLIAAGNAADIISPETSDGRIMGGANASIETYPYQVSLMNYGWHECGGSIISARWILTAAHCVDKRGIRNLSVRTGSFLASSGGNVSLVIQIVKHENYTFTEQGTPIHDIALVRLARPLVFDKTCQPIGLYKSGEEVSSGLVSVVSGWGLTNFGYPKTLQSVSLPILDKKLCNETYATLGGISEGQICAGYYEEGSKDACFGDSGGPLAIKGRLAGIVSWGDGCAEAYKPGVYTEVAYYRKWIEQHTGV